MAGICSHLEVVLSRLLWIFVHSSRTHNGLLQGGKLNESYRIFPNIIQHFNQSVILQTEGGPGWEAMLRWWWWLWLAVFKAALLGCIICIIMHNTILCERSVQSCISLANQVWNCKQEVYLGFPALPQTVFSASLSRYEMWEGMETRLGTKQSMMCAVDLATTVLLLLLLLYWTTPAYDSCCITH